MADIQAAVGLEMALTAGLGDSHAAAARLGGLLDTADASVRAALP